MKFYDVFLKIKIYGKEIGTTSLSVRSKDPFDAVIKAEGEADGIYGDDVVCHAVRADEITEDEYNFQQAC